MDGRAVRTLILACAVAAALPAMAGAPRAASAPRAARRALVVGIDAYPPNGRWQRLEGAVADAQAMAAYLESNGFTVVRLLDGEATADGIRLAFRRTLVDPAEPDDLGVFYYAGHGSQVRNSLARKIDKHDETIVPVDGRDIRSLELGRWLEEAAGRGLRLTAVFDSCHSGGVTRGLAEGGLRRRSALADETDHPDASPRPDPAGAGVLLLFAARPEQAAQEQEGEAHHGVFTSALLSVLAASAPDATATQLFVQVHARVKVEGRNRQDPVMEGARDRREAPPFGLPARGAEGRPLVAAGRRVEGGEVELLAGAAIGLAPGTTLVRAATRARPMVRLTVSSVAGPSRSLARAAREADGPIGSVEPGDAFEVERWARPSLSRLRIQVGPAAPSPQVAAWNSALQPLRASRKVHWVDDPASLEPTHQLFWRGGAWRLRRPDGREEVLGALPSPGRIEAELAGAGVAERGPPCDQRACLFVRLPVPTELVDALGWGRAEPAPTAAVGPGEAADYVLVSRVGVRAPEYALVAAAGAAGESFPGAAGGLCSPRTTLPLRTDWTGGAGAGARLQDDAAKLARVKGWLSAAPQDDGRFPYHLELRDHGKSLGPVSVPEPGGGGVHLEPPRVKPDAALELWLVPDGPRLARGAAARFPYVFAIDCKGAIELAYPRNGREPARLPPSGPDARADEPIRLDEPIELDGTRGLYTFLLLVSSEPIGDLSAATQAGVRRGALTDAGDGLGTYLGGLGASRGSNPRPLKVDWSIERVEVLAVP